MANDQLVLVTGGSGHVGFRTLAFALQSGYRVRAAVRSPEKAAQIKGAKSVQGYPDRLEFVMVPDIVADGAYEEAVKRVDYVLHVASPITFPVGGVFALIVTDISGEEEWKGWRTVTDRSVDR
jgi:uncharacterized protein YbjT (DUF2867 family)